MTVLVLGGSGATGRLLIEQLVLRGERVRAIVRSIGKMPEYLHHHDQVSLVESSLLNLSDEELIKHVLDCDAVVSCLGHNINMRGLWGPPYRLVTNATQRLCGAIKAAAPHNKTKFILMNTAGNRNLDQEELVSITEEAVLWILRRLIPPHADNEAAAEYLRTEIGQADPEIEWVAVRPDTLIDNNKVSDYEAHLSPIRSAIFNAGETSRMNVAHFMAELIANEDLWGKWKGTMPVIYNMR